MDYCNQNLRILFEHIDRTPILFSIRFLLSIICFFVNATHYMHRVNISFAIICMVNKTCDLKSSNISFSTNDNLINKTLNIMNDYLLPTTTISNYGNYTFNISSNLTDNDKDFKCSVIYYDGYLLKN